MTTLTPVLVRKERLSVPEVLELFESLLNYREFISVLPPVRAKGGEVYLYRNEERPGK